MGHSKSTLRKKFIAMNAYVKEKERPQINKLTLHFQEVGKNKQKTTKAKVSRRKEIKIRAE